MSEELSGRGLPADVDLLVEAEHDERCERRILMRQVVIVLMLVALLVTHALLG